MKKNKFKKSAAIALVALILGSTAPSVASAATDDNSNSQIQTYVINRNSKTKSQAINFNTSVSFIAKPSKLNYIHFIRKFLKKHFGIK